jgi:hypothetical protein
MRLVHVSTLALSFCMLVVPTLHAQDDASRVVAGGGISVPQWTGKIDANEERSGRTLNDAKLTKDGDTFRVTTGPAVTYWSPAGKAAGDYTVKATFTEPKYMNLNSHPHPYGIFIAGNEMGTAGQSYLYCAAYGDGRFIVRGFGPGAFQMNGFRGDTNPAVHTAAGVGQPVTQEIALSVKGDRVECSINGTVVAGYNKAALVTEGIKSTDGVYGLRFAHNTEVTVTGLRVQKN